MTDTPAPSSVASAPIRDILVQLTGSDEDDGRLQMAAAVAGAFGAHIVAAHVHILPDILEITDPARSAMVRTLLENSDREADAAVDRLQARLAALGMPHHLVRLHGLAADIGAELAAMARAADLFVGTRPYGDPAGRDQIEERVLFGSGRACLFLPPGGTPHRAFDSIAIAWDNSREAARAVAEAMPFLERARSVRLIHVDSNGAEAAAHGRDFAGILAHLERHGIEAGLVSVPFSGSTGEQIEQAAHQQAADLIVMGAYGHMRLVEFIFGGATRYILRHATLPVLIAH
ncbi:MAG TPA: universal stress protein [Hypericibacter adhaerens]|uniref:universal stress protein n=1 Tax=Hypericibacter adhaerens TaxID=2602016 RepID=UPI002CA6A69D|nr:universal stress protein [Hypericibacter adhaerens]HWA42079.1 universal stress protein [Hypericibacter adhaerens]